MTFVKCTVTNCEYWGEGNVCIADQITVKSTKADGEASNLLETVCETFENKES